MKMKSAISLVAIAIAGLATALFPGMATVASAQQPGSLKLEGSWRVMVQLQVCTNGNPVGAPFQSMLSFARGGSLTETTANSMFFPAERGPGHGAWTVLGGNAYNATSTAFVTLNGQLVKTQTITQHIQLNEKTDTWSSVAVVQFFDPSGNPLMTGCATATAVRLP